MCDPVRGLFDNPSKGWGLRPSAGEGGDERDTEEQSFGSLQCPQPSLYHDEGQGSLTKSYIWCFGDVGDRHVRCLVPFLSNASELHRAGVRIR